MASHKKSHNAHAVLPEESVNGSLDHPLELKLVCSIFDHWQEGIIITNTRGTILYANPFFKKTAVIPDKEVVGTSGFLFIRKFLPKHASRILLHYLHDVLHGKEVPPCELVIDNRVFEVYFPRENLEQSILFFFIRDITSQKDVEARLQHERDIFAAYMETIPIAITQVNTEGKITYANNRAEEVLGLLKSNITDLTYNAPQWHITDFNGNPFPKEQLPFVQVMTAGVPVYDVRHAIRWPDDRQRFLSINAAPLFSGTEECVGMVGAIEDITERILAEQALQESEERYRAMFTHMRSGVAVYEVVGNGEDFIFRDFNPSAERISNIEREKVIGKGLLDLFPHMDRSGLFAALQEVYRSGEALHLPAFYYKDKVRDGWRENFIYKLPNGNVVAIYDDVTERELAIRTLRENEALYKMVAELTSDYIFKVAVAPDGTLQLTNTSENFTSMTGRSLAEATTVDTWEKIIHPDDWPQFQRVIHRVLTKGDATSFECRSFTAEGIQRWIRIAVRPQFDEEQGRVTIILGSVKDISERKRSEETLRNTQRLEALGVLAGGIAHDFNNLLGGMFGYLDMVKEALEGNESKTALQYLEKALTVYNRTRNLTRQLLTFSKGGVPDKKTMNIDSLLRETTGFVLSGSNVTAEVHITDGLWQCDIDPNQFSQAIDNIIINARQAMPKGGVITVSAENIFDPTRLPRQLPVGRYVHIAVKDEGIGIPADYLSRIFDPFFTTKKEGSGLGLATCYSIITRHGGALEAESEPGKGTTFHFYLSASEYSDSRDDIQTFRRHKGVGRVLVMDDEEYIRDVTSRMLMKMGYQTESALHGDDAVEKFDAACAAGTPFKILLLDLTIAGGKGGLETIHILRQKGIPFHAIAASGYSDDPVIVNPREYGFDASIKKPFRKIHLEETLERLVSSK